MDEPIAEMILRVLTPEGVRRWWDLPIAELGGSTPRQALAAGREAEVRTLVESYLDPSYG